MALAILDSKVYKAYVYYDAGLTLTYFMSRSKFLIALMSGERLQDYGPQVVIKGLKCLPVKSKDADLRGLFCSLTAKWVSHDHFSRVVRKLDFCICENKAADQLCGNPTADQRLCFRYTDSTIPLLPKSKISSL